MNGSAPPAVSRLFFPQFPLLGPILHMHGYLPSQTYHPINYLTSLPQKYGQIWREISIFYIHSWVHSAKRHDIKQYRRCCLVYMRSEKWRRWAKSILYSIWSTSSLSVSSHLPDAFLSRVHLVLAFLWTSTFIRIVLTMWCRLKPTAKKPKKVNESFHFPGVDSFKRISDHLPPAHPNLC